MLRERIRVRAYRKRPYEQYILSNRSRSFIHDLVEGQELNQKEKRARILRQVIIFGTVIILVLLYVAYRLDIGDFG